MRRLLLPLSSLVLALCFAQAATATTVLRVPLDEMARKSTLVLHGTIRSSTVVAIADNPRHLRTDVVVDVVEVLKGPRSTRTLTLELPGGQRGAWAMRIPGMPSFREGEEVVLFLEKTASNWALTGLGQGKFTVESTAEGTKRVRRHLDGLHFVGFDARGKLVAITAPLDDPNLSLTALLASVKTALTTRPQGR